VRRTKRVCQPGSRGVEPTGATDAEAGDRGAARTRRADTGIDASGGEPGEHEQRTDDLHDLIDFKLVTTTGLPNGASSWQTGYGAHRVRGHRALHPQGHLRCFTRDRDVTRATSAICLCGGLGHTSF
jgi:hypothetical protein